jgi:cyclopropane fatty-acyl-phospholipid synthase-like methyltransferase
MEMEAFFKLHSGLPREGPGSDASTRKAIRALPSLPPSPRVVDLGCGPGRQTLVLAQALSSSIIAADIHQPYLDQLQTSAAQAGLNARIKTRNISMDALDYPEGSIDLVWSEGALYAVGVSKMLQLLHPMLRPKGLLAFTEISWLVSNPPGEAAEFWKAYGAMGGIEQNIRKITSAGYRVFSHFTLPREDWWDEYYNPLLRRIEILRLDSENSSAVAAVMESTEKEIDLHRQWGPTYAYVFYLCQKSG